MFEFECHFCPNVLIVNMEFIFDSDGDLGYYGNVLDAYMKQKHRMIWERRHGKIGSGMKNEQQDE